MYVSPCKSFPVECPLYLVSRPYRYGPTPSLHTGPFRGTPDLHVRGEVFVFILVFNERWGDGHEPRPLRWESESG